MKYPCNYHWIYFGMRSNPGDILPEQRPHVRSLIAGSHRQWRRKLSQPTSERNLGFGPRKRPVLRWAMALVQWLVVSCWVISGYMMGKLTSLWKDPPFLMGKLTISMAIFNSKLLVYQRVYDGLTVTNQRTNPMARLCGWPHFMTLPGCWISTAGWLCRFQV